MQKENKGLVCCIVILFIAVFCLAGYLVYDKIYLREEKNNPQLNDNKQEENNEVENTLEEEKEESLSLSNPLVSKYFYIYKLYEEQCEKNDDLNTSDEAKNYLTYLQIPNAYISTISCREAENAIVDNYYCGATRDSILDVVTEDSVLNNFTQLLSADLFNSKYQEIFGQNQKSSFSDITKFGGMYHFDKKLNGYIYYLINAGGSCGNYSVSFKSATKKGDTLKLVLSKTSPEEVEEVTYTLKYEEETANYIFESVSRK